MEIYIVSEHKNISEMLCNNGSHCNISNLMHVDYSSDLNINKELFWKESKCENRLLTNSLGRFSWNFNEVGATLLHKNFEL